LLTFTGNVANGIEPQDVSMVSLIADPQRFNGQFIRVIGFLHLEFEGNHLYLHSEDYKQAIYKNGLWLSLTKVQIKKEIKLSNRYVIAEGIFNSENKGHMGLSSGSLEKITRLDKW
jgi:hypothetical protein